MQYGEGNPIRYIAVGGAGGSTIAADQVGLLPQTGPDLMIQAAVYAAAFLAIWGITYLGLSRIRKTA